jgi:hypothetical protein
MLSAPIPTVKNPAKSWETSLEYSFGNAALVKTLDDGYQTECRSGCYRLRPFPVPEELDLLFGFKFGLLGEAVWYRHLEL